MLMSRGFPGCFFSAYNNQPYQQMHAGIHRITSYISATYIDCPSQPFDSIIVVYKVR